MLRWTIVFFSYYSVCDSASFKCKIENFGCQSAAEQAASVRQLRQSRDEHMRLSSHKATPNMPERADKKWKTLLWNQRQCPSRQMEPLNYDLETTMDELKQW